MTLSGTDAGDFDSTGGGLSPRSTLRISFGSTPDYEAPSDADTDNEYELTLTATDDASPSASRDRSVTVSVTNMNEPGTVSFTPSSLQVGQKVTARLRDPDGGVTNKSWSWSRVDAPRARPPP